MFFLNNIQGESFGKGCLIRVELICNSIIHWSCSLYRRDNIYTYRKFSSFRPKRIITMALTEPPWRFIIVLSTSCFLGKGFGLYGKVLGQQMALVKELPGFQSLGDPMEFFFQILHHGKEEGKKLKNFKLQNSWFSQRKFLLDFSLRN